MLRLTGGTLAGASVAGSGTAAAESPSTFEAVDGDPSIERVDGLRLGHLATPSRGTEAVVWTDGDGTVHADGVDGVIASDDEFSAVLQAAVDEASKVTLQTGTYVLNEPVEIPSGTTVEGAGKRATEIVVKARKGFIVAGEKGAKTRLNGGVREGDVSLPVDSTRGFENDDFVLLTSDARSEYLGIPTGEIQQVTEAARRSLEIPDTGALYGYESSEDVSVTRLDVARHVAIRHLGLVGADLDTYRVGVLLKYADRVQIEHCRIGHFAAMGVYNRSSTNVVVRETDLFECAHPSSGYGYGLAANGAARNMRVEACTFREFKMHGTAVGGAPFEGKPTLLQFVNNTYYRNDADIHTSGLVLFENNRFLGDESGIFTGADVTVVENNTFKNINGAAVADRGDPNELYVHGNRFENIGGSAFGFYSSPSRLNTVRIDGNTFKDVDGNIVRHRAAKGTRVKLFAFSNNMVENVDGFVAYSEDGEGDLREAIFSDNVVHTVTGNVVFGTGNCDAEVEMTGNRIFNVENKYVLIARGAANSVKNNLVSGYSDHAMLVWKPTMITGNAFRWGDDDAIVASRGSDICILMNEFTGTEGADVNAYGKVSNCNVLLNRVNAGIRAADHHNVQLNF